MVQPIDEIVKAHGDEIKVKSKMVKVNNLLFRYLRKKTFGFINT